MIKSITPETATLKDVIEELNRLRERVDNLEDLRDLNTAIERNAGKQGTPWDQVCQEFGWDFDQNKETKHR